MEKRQFQWERLILHITCVILFIIVEAAGAYYFKDRLTERKNYHQENAQNNIIDTKGYSIQGNQYRTIADDPQILIQNTLPWTDRVEVRFGEKIPAGMRVQVYYQAVGGTMTEQASVITSAGAGAEEAVLSIPGGEYNLLRLDIDGDFALESVDLYGEYMIGLSRTNRVIILSSVILLLAIAVFVIYRMNRQYYQGVWSVFQEAWKRSPRWDRRDAVKIFLRVYIPLGLVLFIFVNGRYMNASGYVRYRWPDGLASQGVSGYTEKDGVYCYHQDRDCCLTLAGGEGVRKVLVELKDFAEKDVAVPYYAIDANGRPGAEQAIRWERGTNVLTLELPEADYQEIGIKIPADFSVDKLYYISGEGVRGNMAEALAAQGILLLLLLLLMHFGPAKIVLEKYRNWVDRAIAAHWKKAGIFTAAAALTALAALAALKILSVAGVCAWNAKTASFFVVSAWIMAAIILLNKYFSARVEAIGFLVILLTGSLFVLILPSNVGLSWDDQIHYDQASILAELDSPYRVVSDDIIKEYAYIPRMNLDRRLQRSSYQIVDTLDREECYQPKPGVDWKKLSTWVPYIPSAVGLRMARGIGMPFHVQVMVGRWMNVLLLAVLCYFAMRKLKNGKIVVLLMALIPTNIFIAANYTYDTWLTGWIILGFSLFMGELQEREKTIHTGTLAAIPAAMCLAVMPKMVYLPMTLLVLFMPRRKFRSREQGCIYYALVFFAMALPFLLLYFNTLGSDAGISAVQDMRGGSQVGAGSQLDYIKSHAVTFAQTIVNFLTQYLNPDGRLDGYITNMAYVGVAPYISQLGMICVFAAGALFHHEDDARIPWWYRLGTLGMYAGIGAICAVSMYIAFSPVGASTVSGCQGRYLLPVVFPTVYVLTRIPVRGKKWKTFLARYRVDRIVDMALAGFFVLVSLLSVWHNVVLLY